MRIVSILLAPLVTFLAALPLGCGYPEAKKELEATRAELADVRQKVEAMETQVAEQDDAAWAKQEQQAVGSAKSLEKSLQQSATETAGQEMKKNEASLAELRADIAKLREEFGPSVREVLGEENKPQEEAVEAVRKELGVLHKETEALADRIEEARAADARLNETRRVLDAEANDLRQQLTEMETQLRKLQK
jgi:chromosome segregation ATPase